MTYRRFQFILSKCVGIRISVVEWSKPFMAQQWCQNIARAAGDGPTEGKMEQYL